MADNSARGKRIKLWRARVKLNGEPEVFLGYFATREEAVREENEYVDAFCPDPGTCHHRRHIAERRMSA